MPDQKAEVGAPVGSYEMWQPGRVDAALLAIVATVVALVPTAYFVFLVFVVRSRNCTPGAQAWDAEITVYAGAAVLVAVAWTTVGSLLRVATGRPGFRRRAWVLVAVLAVVASCAHARYGAVANPSLEFCSQMVLN
jgi:hypothetical protein